MSKEAFSRLENKLDNIQSDVTDIKLEQVSQHKDIIHIEKDLEEHMRRTELAEQRIKLIEDRTAWSWIKDNIKTISVLIGVIIMLFGGLEWFIKYIMTVK